MIRFFLLLGLVLALVLSSPAAGQTPDPPPTSGTTQQPTADPQIELNLISLPTTQSVKRHHGYFRLNHRFARDLRLGDFGDLAADLFALDNGAVLGLEYRFGLTDSIHAGVHRSTEAKTLQVFGRWDTIRQGGSFPIGASAFVSTEGLDNLQDARQPALGVVLSRTWGQRLAVYASPTYVDGTHLAALEEDVDNRTLYVGLGARARLRPSVFVVGEYSPRMSGYAPGDPMWGLALEKWTRGHTLALTLTNSFATTPGQIARGGTPDALYLGFNITRKF
ncbi:MAG: hypothetical protein H0U19_04340 [Acidobacteria bacterium]|nr:hypothetical protein [Acidobacteriota bacterium]